LATIHDRKDQLINCFWRQVNRSPDERRLAKALIFSLGIHFFLMFFWGGIWRFNSNKDLVMGTVSFGMAGLTHSAPAFLIVRLAEGQGSTPFAESDNESSSTLPDQLNANVLDRINPVVPSTYQLDSINRSTETLARGAKDDAAQVGSFSSISEEAVLLARRAGYVQANLLDTSPYPLIDITPEYPDSARNQHGKVVLRLYIGENGDVDDLIVVRATPRGLFEQAAITAFAKGRFSPGMKAGLAIKSQIAVEVEFTPFNRGADVSGHSY
jgi:TonB family protein